MLTESDLELPRRLRHAFGGRFADAVVLGSGPHGTVLRAHDSAYGEVALKLLTAHAPDMAEQGALAVQRASDALDHPRVVHVLEVLRDGGLVAVLTPYLSGGSLESRMGGDPMAWDAIQDVVRAVAEILDHAGEQHIVHGGVSPANIVFDAAGRPFLRDFGITQTFAGFTRDTVAEAYAAPEWWRGNHLSPQSDQYSLAVVALELITGRRRIDAPEVEGIQVLEPLEIPATAALRPGLSLVANRVLSQGLAASPSNRFASSGEFAHALAAAPYEHGGKRRKGREVSWRGVQLSVVAAAALVAVVVAIDASQRLSAREGLGEIERRTRGLAEGFDAITGRAAEGVEAPEVRPVSGGRARDAAGRVTANAPAPRIGLPDVPGRPSLGGALPSARDVRTGAAMRSTAVGAAMRGSVDSVSSGGARAVDVVPSGNATTALGAGINQASRVAADVVDTVRTRASNEIPQAAAGATVPVGSGSQSGGGGGRASTTSGGATVAPSGPSVRGDRGTAATSEDRSASPFAYLAVTSDERRLVLVDGVPRGRTPTIVRVAPGPHQVSAFGLPKTRVRASAGDTLSVRLTGTRP